MQMRSQFNIQYKYKFELGLVRTHISSDLAVWRNPTRPCAHGGNISNYI